MRVYGETIAPETIAAAVERMTGEFRAIDIESVFRRCGHTSSNVTNRATDRLLQRERKAGRIEVVPENKRYWRVAAGGDA